MNKQDLKNLSKTVSMVVKPLSERNRDIIARRFGLGSGKRETLESIGQSYGITRERVRQIEEATLAQLTAGAADNRDIARYVAQVKDVLNTQGGIMRERDLFAAVCGTDNSTPATAALTFLLTLNRELLHSDDNDHFHAFWAVDQKKADTLRTTIGALTKAMEAKGTVVSENELYDFARAQGVLGGNGTDITGKQLTTLMAVSKDIGKNIFGEVGLTSWSEVKPKGVRDKAYLIMKREGNARHFADIAKLINTARFDKKAVNIQTVHNELIKDDRFVLVGRGLYALSEWGYKSGTVKEVLVDILKQAQGPLPKADLVARVMDARIVKENTVLLNLQDSSRFVRNDDGTYTLRKA